MSIIIQNIDPNPRRTAQSRLRRLTTKSHCEYIAHARKEPTP